MEGYRAMGATAVGICVKCELCTTPAAAAVAYCRCSLEGVLRVLRIEATAFGGICVRGSMMGCGDYDDGQRLKPGVAVL